ncbi:ATPase AAA [Pseudidiomarina salinarum]|uniref:ATPase AAA n=1 Tax=Pseudidiomarina salinarum TaxID=435908 RepID=A0A094IVL1_9GAMM|nr:AAA family ATPase [Pseudidiomarina salinarum]KFZ31172.1 ATPase AAA [Pseudidiomarina salinarum]RUO71080.1 AAA family ATPase [Pseudidiomarina salinarum]
MYQKHYGLRELPFTLTPNTSFYCDLEGHRSALEVLLTALETGEGFIKVVGEVGTGKTLLCRKLLNELPDQFVSAYIPNPHLTPDELRSQIGRELQIDTAELDNQQLLTQAIQQRLMDINKDGKTVVIVLDEAQALPSDSLEALRLISNLETETRKLLHIVLFGQPELNERLAQREHRQLRQRIAFSYNLKAMTMHELAHYISHRLYVAGYKGPPIFSGRVVQQLHEASRGIPRLANVLCHKVLLLCYGEGVYAVTPKQVRAAVADTEDVELARSRWGWVAAACIIVIAAVVGLSYYQGWLTGYLR